MPSTLQPSTPKRSALSRIISAGQRLQILAVSLIGMHGSRKTDRALGLEDARNILVIRLDELGDVIMSTAFLRSLRAQAPDARITLTVQKGLVPLFHECGDVDEVVGYDCAGGHLRRYLTLPRKAWALGRSLRSQRDYDLAVLPRWDGDPYFGAYIAYFARARRRVGFSETVSPYKRSINPGIDRLLTDAVKDEGLAHEVERIPTLLRALGGEAADLTPTLTPTVEDLAVADDLLRRHGRHEGQRLIAICPSGGHSSLKQWPVERFAQVAKELAARRPCRFVVIGGPGEEALGRDLKAALDSVIDTTGRTTLRQMAALLSRCDCYLGNDTGPMHVATAVGTRVVALFGPTCTHRYRPYGDGHRVVSLPMTCSPCGRDTHEDRCKRCIYDRPECLLQITPEQVVAEVEEILKAQDINLRTA